MKDAREGFAHHKGTQWMNGRKAKKTTESPRAANLGYLMIKKCVMSENWAQKTAGRTVLVLVSAGHGVWPLLALLSLKLPLNPPELDMISLQ